MSCHMCGLCGLCGMTPTEFDAHMVAFHHGESKRAVQCSYCNINFDTQSQRTTHFRTVSHDFPARKCMKCGFGTLMGAAMRKHLRSECPRIADDAGSADAETVDYPARGEKRKRSDYDLIEPRAAKITRFDEEFRARMAQMIEIVKDEDAELCEQSSELSTRLDFLIEEERKNIEQQCTIRGRQDEITKKRSELMLTLDRLNGI